MINNDTDVLADVLKTIRLTGSTYFCADFSSPWGMDIDAGEQGLFHVVVNGSCQLQLANSQTLLQLQQGDIVAFPTGGGHWISDSQTSDRLPSMEVVEKILSGKNPFTNTHPPIETAATILCGSFSYDTSIQHPFLIDLPCFIHIKAVETPELEWLRSMVKVLSNESRMPSPGSTIMVHRLTEVLFIQLMRFHTHSAGHDMGYIAALADPYIGKALNLIHAEQDAYLSVERLADAVTLSRTAFSDKFSKMVGMPPKSYLQNWRMQRAKTYLEENELSMYDIAEKAGYSSEASFSKAFKAFFAVTPGQVRRR